MNSPPLDPPLAGIWRHVSTAWDWVLCVLLGLALGVALFAPTAQAAPAKPGKVITERLAPHEPVPTPAQPNPAVQGHVYTSESAIAAARANAAACPRCGWVESVNAIDPMGLPPGVVIGVGQNLGSRPGQHPHANAHPGPYPGPYPDIPPSHALTPRPVRGQAAQPSAGFGPIAVGIAPGASQAAVGQLTRFHVRVRLDDGSAVTMEQLTAPRLGERVQIEQGQIVPAPGALKADSTGVRQPASVTGKVYSTP